MWKVAAGLVVVVGAWGAGTGMVNETRLDADARAYAAQDTLGKSIFSGKGTCFACHGPEGKGTPLAPNLTDTTWLNIEKPATVEKVVTLVKTGVPQPKQAPAPMLPMGGAQLTDAEVQAVAVFVLSLSRDTTAFPNR